MAAQRARDYEYYYGNTVPQPDYEPQPRHKDAPAKKTRTNTKGRRHRRNARFMNRAYVVAMTLAVVVALFVCVNYVRLQKSISLYSAEIAKMQLELADLREANNTKYNTLVDSVNVDEIREKAVTELGMVYASTEQVVFYEEPTTDYVTQYESIPENGVVVPAKNSRK
ncbi:MAG: hypothetical protein MJ097_05895 [Dorea sp.]|nr:hypothetical protein [Dorea sp.]